MTTQSSSDVLTIRGLNHWFGEGEAQKQVLHDINLTLKPGELVILMGASGSGKTTLLTLAGCLRSLQSGRIHLLGRELAGASEATLVTSRRQLGFIFQAHNLHESLTALENVRMGLEVHGRPAMTGWENKARAMLGELGLGERLNYLPSRLSGGQKQRVAIARALVANPPLIFADEPTAALDKDSGLAVVQLFLQRARSTGTTILMVTHDNRILDLADRIIVMEDGRLKSDTTRHAA